MFVPRKNLRGWAVSACATIALCGPPNGLLQAQQPDNSAVNKGEHPTAQSQSGHMSDREITAKIRRDLIADKDLSTYGHNVKIITRNGAVTLKGPVHTADEKQAIEARAAGIVGQDKVSNQLTIKQ